jgi:GNAT superfamily N-acetyltransferase
VNQAYIGELAEAESQGMGRALLGSVEGWAREHGLRLLVLDTGSANERGRRFYTRSGFLEEGVRLT